jgi:hypothetical protein
MISVDTRTRPQIKVLPKPMHNKKYFPGTTKVYLCPILIIAGVMLSHDNIYWTALTASEFIKMREFVEVIVSYLPLSHVAANMIDIWY